MVRVYLSLVNALASARLLKLGSRNEMKLIYDSTTDSLYIELSDDLAADSRPLAEGVVGDFNSAGTLIGLDIEHARDSVDLQRIVAEGLPDLPARAA